MSNRWFYFLIFPLLLFTVGCASSKGEKRAKSKRENKPAFLQQTGSNLNRKLEFEDENAESRKKKEKRKATGKVDADFLLRDGFR